MSAAAEPAPPKRFRALLQKLANEVLTDHCMVVLAVLMVPTTFLPYVVEFSPFILWLFEAINAVILAAFVVEYAAKLTLAESKAAYVRDPWHILDLVIIVFGLADWMPFVEFKAGRASPALRLLRLGRVFAVAGRAAQRARRLRARRGAEGAATQTSIRALEEGRTVPSATVEEAARLLVSPSETWADLQGVTSRELDVLGQALGIPRDVIAGKAVQESFPHIDFYEQFTTIFLWDSRLVEAESGPSAISVSKGGFLVIAAGSNIVTLSPGNTLLFDRIVQEGLALPEESFLTRVLYSIMRLKLKDYGEIVWAVERRVADLEEAPLGRLGATFLAETFHLKKEIQKTLYNLWHFRQVLDSICARKHVWGQMREETIEMFGVLREEAEYQYDTLGNVKESLISLIELHINTVSLDMNRTMRLLAVITALSLIPAIIGGMLGENLVDQPYNVKLWEVFLVVLSMMGLGFYAFWRKGWLR